MTKGFYHKEWYAWRDEVLRHVRFRPDHEAIAKELYAHYEDHARDLERIGYEEPLARERALAAMGDAAEVGKGLDAAHKPFWGWLLKATEWMAVALVLMLLWTMVFAEGAQSLWRKTTGQLRWQDPPAYADCVETEFGEIYMTLEEPYTEPETGELCQNLSFWMERNDPLAGAPDGLRWYAEITTDQGVFDRNGKNEDGTWRESGYYDLATPEEFWIDDSFTRYQWCVRLRITEPVEWVEVCHPFQDWVLRAERRAGG